MVYVKGSIFITIFIKDIKIECVQKNIERRQIQGEKELSSSSPWYGMQISLMSTV